MGFFDMVWEKEAWDRPGYNPKNGKVRALFRWEGCAPFKGVFHPESGEVVVGCKFTRPHARAFHFAWWNFFLCFIMWFAISPMMPTLKKFKCDAPDSEVCKACALKFPTDDMKFWGDDEKDMAGPKGARDPKCRVCYPYEGRAKGRAGCGGLGLTDQEVKVSTLIGIAGTFILRVFLGPIAEATGVRQCYALLLIFGSIPGFALSGAMDYNAIYAFRFFVGWIGGSFGDDLVVHFAFTMLCSSRFFCVTTCIATPAGSDVLVVFVGSAHFHVDHDLLRR